MKNDDKQGDIFNGFKSEPEPKSEQKSNITAGDVCRFYKARILSERQADIEANLIPLEPVIQCVLNFDSHLAKKKVFIYGSMPMKAI